MYSIDQYRKFRVRWTALAIVSSLIGILSVWGSQALWSYQDSEALENQGVNWLTGAGGFALAVVGFGCIFATFFCADMAYKMSRKIQSKNVRNRKHQAVGRPNGRYTDIKPDPQAVVDSPRWS